MALRFDNLLLLPMDGAADAPLGDVRKGSLRIIGDRIAALGIVPAGDDDTVFECDGLVALPGFVQGHVHLCQTLFRGLADDLPLLEWLQRRIWPLEAAHDAHSIRASAELSVMELLLGGTTAFQAMETTRHTELAFDVAMQTGVTALIGNCLMDDPEGAPVGLVTSRREAMHICQELHHAFHGEGRARYVVSPRFLLSCTDALLREVAEFATQHELRIHTHACEHPDEVAAVRERTGTDYILALEDHGLLGPLSSLAHCVHTTPAEREAMAQSETAVLHCPTTNLKLGSGIAPIDDYRRLGLRIALGADGAPCNNRLSALSEVREAALLQALAAGPGTWPAEQALWTLTCGGAQALRLDRELGTLEVGKRADVVLCDTATLEPGGSIAAQLVYQATDAHIRHVLVGGEFAVQSGRAVTFDQDAVRANAREACNDLLARADLP